MTEENVIVGTPDDRKPDLPPPSTSSGPLAWLKDNLFSSPLNIALTIVVAAGAVLTDQWRFIPGAIVVGLLVDGLVRSVRQRWRTRLAAAALPALTLLALGFTIGASGSLAWSLTLLFGVALASAAIGWGIAEAVVRLLPRPQAPEVVPPEPA